VRVQLRIVEERRPMRPGCRFSEIRDCGIQQRCAKFVLDVGPDTGHSFDLLQQLVPMARMAPSATSFRILHHKVCDMCWSGNIQVVTS
jgi:hypothetical protein